MHVGLTHGEWIDIVLWIEIGETVVHEAVGGFVGTDGVYDIEQFGIGLQAPIVDGNLRSRAVGPLWNPTRFEFLDAVRAGRVNKMKEREG